MKPLTVQDALNLPALYDIPRDIGLELVSLFRLRLVSEPQCRKTTHWVAPRARTTTVRI